MKTVRAAGVLLCGAVLAVLPVMAQQDTTPPPPQGQVQGPPPDGGQGGRGGRGGMMNPERRLEMMQKQLNLTTEQTAQIKGIFDESKGKMEELRANTAIAQEDKRPKMMEIHQHEMEKIKAVLTPDQQTKFAAMQEKMRERMQQREGGAGGQQQGPPPPPM